MLGKLVKYEFRATARIMGPMYLVLLASAFGASVSINGLLETDKWFFDMLGGLLVTAFFMAAMAAGILCIVLMIERFRKNLLGDEGYVMFTLPVSVHEHMWAKLIVSSIWFIATAFMIFLASFIVVYHVYALGEIVKGISAWFSQQVIQELTTYYSFSGIRFLLELLVLCFLSCCILCVLFYAAMAVGYSFPNHKSLCSVAVFFAFQFGSQLLGSALIFLADRMQIPTFHLDGPSALHAGMDVIIVLLALYGAIFYLITIFFLQKHLNLE